MEKIFAYPLRIIKGDNGTDQQKIDIVPKLVKLGYEHCNKNWGDSDILVTNFNGTNAYLGWAVKSAQFPNLSDLRTEVTVDQEELILALASICKNDTWQDGEVVINIHSKRLSKTNTERLINQPRDKISNWGTPTISEFVTHFTKEAKKDTWVPKVGDKVKIPTSKSIFNNCFSYFKADIKTSKFCTIEHISKSYISVKLEGDNNNYSFLPIDLESYIEDMKQVEFKVGDLVEIVDKKPRTYYPEMAKVGFIDFIQDVRPTTCKVKGFWYYNENLKLVKTNNMDKKIIGYKLKDDKYKAAYLALTRMSNLVNHPEGYHFTPDSQNCVDLKKVEVLDLWCEPVYQEVVKEKFVNLGDKQVQVTINKGGIYIKSENIYLNVKSLESISTRMECRNTENIGTYDVSFPNVKIGCMTFTKEEVDLVIYTYKELNNL